MSKKVHHHSSRSHASAAPLTNSVPAIHDVRQEATSELIQVRAYGLWESAGRPDGIAASERFWCEAEKEITASRLKAVDSD